MVEYAYITKFVCSRKITFSIDDGKVRNVIFHGGCEGNLRGLGRLVEGMEVEEVIRRLKGIDCEGKGTSCPDQLAEALKRYMDQNGKEQAIS